MWCRYQSALLACLSERGFLYQCTDPEGLDALLCQQSVAGYIGFDLTAESLHVGSLVQLMLLRWMQHYDHVPIVVLGGGTTKIGDPSGKDSARRMLSKEKIEDNKKHISELIGRYMHLDGVRGHVVDNAMWLDALSYIDLLRNVGPHFSINRMLGFDSVKSRLEREQNLSFLEFNYSVLQAYDFVELANRYDCRLQMGGSDQWGNIVSGIELGRKMANHSLYGLTAPLLTMASGAKMGKTADGAVWLSENKYSAYDFWQYWRNVEDADTIKFLKLFTTLPMDEIRSYERLQGQALNEAKIRLANEVTTLCHGKENAKMAEVTAKATFTTQGFGDALPSYSVSSDGCSEVLLTRIVHAMGFAKSHSEARRLVVSGAVKLDDEKVKDLDYVVTHDDFASQTKRRLSVGKKKIGVLMW